MLRLFLLVSIFLSWAAGALAQPCVGIGCGIGAPNTSPNNGLNTPAKVGVVMGPTSGSTAGAYTTASFTGSISGVTLTAISITGTIAANQHLNGAGIQSGTFIISGSGGTWTLSRDNGTIASRAMNTALYNGAVFTGSILGTTLTTSAVTGTIAAGQAIYSPSGNPATFITGPIDSTHWTVNIPQSVVGETMLSDYFDGGAVESPAIWQDPTQGQYGMVYTGWSNVVGGISASSSIGLAWSGDLYRWAKASNSPILLPTGVNGDPDQGGVTGPLIWQEGGTYYLFYIGGTFRGIEAGTITLCLATTTAAPSTWTNASWTRLGTIIPLGTPATASAWRASAVYHPTLTKVGGKYYLFFNAMSSTSGYEQIGYATASSLTGPWTVDDANSPVVPVGAGGAWDSTKAGDPSVYQIGNTWYMAYFGTNGPDASDGVATTSAGSFPLGWAKYANNPVLTKGIVGTFDSQFAHKPFIYQLGQYLFHYYTATNANTTQFRQIALAVHGASTPVAQLERVEVYNNAAISIPNSSTQGISFNSLTEQTGPISHWSGGAPSYVTIKKQGTYILSARLIWNGSSGGGYRQVSFSVNGNSLPSGSNTVEAAGTEPVNQTLTSLATLNFGDQIGVKVYQTSGGVLSINYYAGATPYLTVREIGP